MLKKVLICIKILLRHKLRRQVLPAIWKF